MAERGDGSLPDRLKAFVAKAGDNLLQSPAGPIVIGGIMGAMSGTAVAAPFGAELVEGPTKTADGLSWKGVVRVYSALTELTHLRIPVPGTIPPQWWEWSLPTDFRVTVPRIVGRVGPPGGPPVAVEEAEVVKALVRQARSKAVLAAAGVGSLLGIATGLVASVGSLRPGA